ncbi:MAG: hypothetical protein M3O68_09165 [Thermoproteota archaeon]|nr:hypothetical protein [Thermoproteota archaeon]
MKMKLIIESITVIILIVALIDNLSYLSPVNADKDKDYCYDQVGDGHFCFEKENRCVKVQKHDEIAESPCYNRDRN